MSQSKIAALVLFAVCGCTRTNPDQSLSGISKDGTLRVVRAQSSHLLAGSSLGPSVMAVQVDLVLGNLTSAPIPIQSQRFSVQTSAGMIYQGAFFGGTSGCLEGSSLPSRGAMECVVLFEVPAPASMRALFYAMPDLSALSVSLSAPCVDCGTVPSMTPAPGETCTPTTCAAGSYSKCLVSSPSCSERFLTSDGQSFACASCLDCQAAAAQVANWCNPGTNPTGDAACAAMTDANACGTCCQNNHSAGASRWLSLVTTCECNTPGDCIFECSATFCANQNADTTCADCIEQNIGSGQDCDVSPSCNANADCAAYVSCANNCP
jgi:hypothetical protein